MIDNVKMLSSFPRRELFASRGSLDSPSALWAWSLLYLMTYLYADKRTAHHCIGAAASEGIPLLRTKDHCKRLLICEEGERFSKQISIYFLIQSPMTAPPSQIRYNSSHLRRVYAMQMQWYTLSHPNSCEK